MTSAQGSFLGDAIKDVGGTSITTSAEEEEDRRDPSTFFLGNDNNKDDYGESMANMYCMKLMDAYNDKDDVDVDVDVNNTDVCDTIDVQFTLT